MSRRDRADGGQAAVELALVLPLVASLLLAVVQCGLVVRDHILVVHAAREAAREAAVDADPEAPRRAATEGSTLAADRLTVAAGPRGEAGSRITVEVTYRSPTRVPIVGPLIGDVVVSAKAVMRVEH